MQTFNTTIDELQFTEREAWIIYKSKKGKAHNLAVEFDFDANIEREPSDYDYPGYCQLESVKVEIGKVYLFDDNWSEKREIRTSKAFDKNLRLDIESELELNWENAILEQSE